MLGICWSRTESFSLDLSKPVGRKLSFEDDLVHWLLTS